METNPALPSRTIPSAYRQAVEQLASQMRLDPQALLDGLRFDYKGTGFRLENYGDMDPDGLFLVVEVGEFSDENEGIVCKRLLELNMLVPAARMGYCAVMPGSNVALFCMRIDLAQQPDAHEVVAAAMQALTAELGRTLADLTRAAEKAAGFAEPAAELA